MKKILSRDSAKSQLMALLLLLLLLLLCCSCKTAKQPTAQTMRGLTHDTVYISNTHYDSIYIDNWYYVCHKADTVFREKTRLEYRYKMQHDTVYSVQIDTIPIVSQVEVVREVTHIPKWCKWLSIVGLLSVLGFVATLIIKFRIRNS